MEAKVDQTKPARTMTHLKVDIQSRAGLEGLAWLELPDNDEGCVLVCQQDDSAEDEGENQGQQTVAQHAHRLEERDGAACKQFISRTGTGAQSCRISPT